MDLVWTPTEQRTIDGDRTTAEVVRGDVTGSESGDRDAVSTERLNQDKIYVVASGGWISVLRSYGAWADRPPMQLSLFDFAGKPLLPTPALELDAPRMRRRSWAHLLARLFAIDVTTRPCGGRLKIVEFVVDPDAIARHLLGARAPPRPPPLGQLGLLPP